MPGNQPSGHVSNKIHDADSVLSTIRNKKVQFDDSQFASTPSFIRVPSMLHMIRASSTQFLKSKSTIFKPEPDNSCFCYWFPKLFGVDEEFIPSSDDEGLFAEIWDNEELDAKANALTESELNILRDGSLEDLSDDKLRIAWKKRQIPKYGRRARAKPILKRENSVTFECNCNIDRSFSRHYVPHFGGGEPQENEEFKTPHFAAFWENFREAAEGEDLHQWSSIFEPKKEAENADEKSLFFRPLPKFPGSCRSDLKNFREQLMASFRPLSCREIRRFRMPFPEALYLELQEDLYTDSAQFFKHLLIKDYFASKSSDYVPTLTRNKGRMKYLIEFLKLAEKFSKRKEYHKEAITLLKSGKYFNDHDEHWWWIAEELYKKAVIVSQKSVIDGGKSEAIARYIFGKFLLERVHRVQLAQEHLLKARELSLEKDWNASSVLKSQEPVYKECTNYLCQALIASSKELRKKGKPEKALPLIHRSYKLCLESQSLRRVIEMGTYFELGMTYQALGMLDWAKIALKKFIEIAKLENFPRSVCDGYLELAITYRSEGDLPRCHHSLKSYLEVAEAHQDNNLIAFGKRYLGEFHLNNGDPEIASELFEKSFQSFHNQYMESSKIPLASWEPEHFTLSHDVELTRVLLGLAKGELITKPICHLILKARDVKNKKDTLKLINWKNKREDLTDLQGIMADEGFFASDTDTVDVQLPADGRSPESSVDVHEDPSVEESYYRTVRFAVEPEADIV